MTRPFIESEWIHKPSAVVVSLNLTTSQHKTHIFEYCSWFWTPIRYHSCISLFELTEKMFNFLTVFIGMYLQWTRQNISIPALHLNVKLWVVKNIRISHECHLLLQMYTNGLQEFSVMFIMNWLAFCQDFLILRPFLLKKHILVIFTKILRAVSLLHHHLSSLFTK